MITELLKSRPGERPIITDGGWGTMLLATGLRPGECAELWNMEHPERVKMIADLYAKAGSRLLLTNTYRANRLWLKGFNVESRIREINQRGVRISKEAVGRNGYVFASVGPVKNLSDTRKIHDEELEEIFFEQCALLADAGADGIAVETISDPYEGAVAYRAAKRTGLPVVFSATFSRDYLFGSKLSPSGFKKFTEIIANADIAGINCGSGIEDCLTHIKTIRKYTGAPLWVKPSAGIPSMVRKKIVYPTSIKNFAEYSRIFSSFDVKFIGGCCGTTPEYISKLAAAF